MQPVIPAALLILQNPTNELRSYQMAYGDTALVAGLFACPRLNIHDGIPGRD
jgi:hypothetical protein